MLFPECPMSPVDFILNTNVLDYNVFFFYLYCSIRHSCNLTKSVIFRMIVLPHKGPSFSALANQSVSFIPDFEFTLKERQIFNQPQTTKHMQIYH